jgi:hypothetical protein
MSSLHFFSFLIPSLLIPYSLFISFLLSSLYISSLRFSFPVNLLNSLRFSLLLFSSMIQSSSNFFTSSYTRTYICIQYSSH